MAIPALVGGVLPPGRHDCTQSDIEAAFVTSPTFTGSMSRQKIWEDWQKAVALLTGAAKLYTAWVSGSFLTDKKNPRDIDVVFIVDEEDRAKRAPADQVVIESFILRTPDPLTGTMRPRHGLLVDSYVFNWAPHHLPVGAKVLYAEYAAYAQARGYWDDFWSRVRTGPKGSTPTRQDALPVRGCLEVRFDAYA